MQTSLNETVYWQLFKSVRLLFATDIPWQVQQGSEDDVATQIIIENAGSLIKACMQETPMHISMDQFDTLDTFISFIADDLRIFLYELETLVDDCILHSMGKASVDHVKIKLPKLNALSNMLQCSATDIFDHGRYLEFLCLRQDPSRMKKILTGIEKINKTLMTETTRNRPDTSFVPKAENTSASSSDNSTSWLQTALNPSYWSSSHKLFEVLVSKLRSCSISSHSTMLNLKGLSPFHLQDRQADFDILFPSCPKRDSWQAVVCRVLKESPAESEVDDDTQFESICEAVNLANNYDTMLYIRIHEKDVWYKYCDDQQPAYPKALSTVTISQLIESGYLKDLRGFELRDRWILALNLAQSLLQFHDGPWLQTFWTSENLFLLYENNQGRKLCNIHNPFVTCMISDSPPNLPKFPPFDKFPLIHTFGQFLLELAIGEKLPVMTTKDGQFSPYKTLSHNFNESNMGSLSNDYICAIEGCLKFHKFIKDEKDSDEEVRIRNTIFKKVVQPLERNLRLFIKDPVSSYADNFGAGPERHPSNITKHKHLDLQDSTSLPIRQPNDSAHPIANLPLASETRDVVRIKNLNSIKHKIPNFVFSETPTDYTRQPKQSFGQIAVHDQGGTKRLSSLQSERETPLHVKRDDCDASSDSGSASTTDEAKGILLGSFDTTRSEVEEHTSLKWGETFRRVSWRYSSHFQHTISDEPVRIAILDTGIDLSHPDFQNPRFQSRNGRTIRVAKGEKRQIERIKAYRNFCDGEDNSEDVIDIDGHGTHVAGIILQLAPTAELYIARVCRKGQVDPEIVESAVRWAIHHSVHLINMSFGYRDYDQGLDQALEEAKNCGIVVFAAASNLGNLEGVAWPARDPERAICVHSSNDFGTLRSDFTPDPDSRTVNFMAVGEMVCSHRLVEKGGGFQTMSGTSMATPVATATAALLLAFVRQGACEEQRLETEHEIGPVNLEDLSRMRTLLKHICKEIQPGYHWIKPHLLWPEFSQGKRQAEDPSAVSRQAWEEIRKALIR